MTVYFMAQINIHDRERYAQYEAGFLQILNEHGGALVAVDDAASVVEGAWPYNRTVLLRFDDEAAAMGWYDSDAYQALMQHRQAASAGNIVLVRGLGA